MLHAQLDHMQQLTRSIACASYTHETLHHHGYGSVVVLGCQWHRDGALTMGCRVHMPDELVGHQLGRLHLLQMFLRVQSSGEASWQAGIKSEGVYSTEVVLARKALGQPGKARGGFWNAALHRLWHAYDQLPHFDAGRDHPFAKPGPLQLARMVKRAYAHLDAAELAAEPQPWQLTEAGRSDRRMAPGGLVEKMLDVAIRHQQLVLAHLRNAPAGGQAARARYRQAIATLLRDDVSGSASPQP